MFQSRKQAGRASLAAQSAKHRTVDGLRAALEAVPDRIAPQHVATIAAAGIDGELALLLRTDEDMLKLLGESAPAAIGDRLRMLVALHAAAIEPPPQLHTAERRRIGEDVVSTVLSAGGKGLQELSPRFKILMQMECVFLLSGLMSRTNHVSQAKVRDSSTMPACCLPKTRLFLPFTMLNSPFDINP